MSEVGRKPSLRGCGAPWEEDRSLGSCRGVHSPQLLQFREPIRKRSGGMAGRVPGRVTAALPRNARTRSLLSPHGQQTRAWQPGTRAEGGIRGPGERQPGLTGRFRSADQAPGGYQMKTASLKIRSARALGDEVSSACAQRGLVGGWAGNKGKSWRRLRHLAGVVRDRLAGGDPGILSEGG